MLMMKIPKVFFGASVDDSLIKVGTYSSHEASYTGCPKF